MGLFVENEVPSVRAAKLWRPPPPHGQPYSVELPGSKRDGRTNVYRHWRAQGGLVENMDPACPTVHDGFEQAGKFSSIPVAMDTLLSRGPSAQD